MNRGDPVSRHNKLLLLRTRSADELDVAMLIAWSRDDDKDVRDWATFALGSQTSLDNDDIRQALRDRLKDTDFDTRCEALVGLARRRDDAGIGPLMAALQSDEVSTMMIEAAGYYGTKDLVPVLKALRDWWDVDDERLENAIAHCDGTRRDWWWLSDGRIGNDE